MTDEDLQGALEGFDVLWEAMRTGDMHLVTAALSVQMAKGQRTGFVTAAALAGVTGMSKTGANFQNAPDGGFFAPAFSRQGKPIALSEVPEHVALAAQMMVAVANDDTDMEVAIFASAVKLGPDVFTGFMVELAARATQAIQEAMK